MDFNIKSILAGICISIGCIVNIKSGLGLQGALLFSLGLMSVVCFGYNLYTGKAGFLTFRDKESNITPKKLLYILIGNIFGCVTLGFASLSFFNTNNYDILNKVVNVYQTSDLSLYNIMSFLTKAILCGMLMSTAVLHYKKSMLILILCVTVFILCGFRHSIADAYYLSAYLIQDNPVSINALIYYIIVVLGNFIGCNLYKR